MKIFISLLTTLLFSPLLSNGQRTDESLTVFLPKGHVIFEKIYGDLNKDGLEDCVIITKGTDKSKVIKNRFDEIVDRNRRGIVVLFQSKEGYKKVLTNNQAFSSENEDGGVYFPPELSTSIKNGILYFHYSHGRYGYWKYTFRYQNDDFELIGFDSTSSHGPVIDRK